MFTLPALYQEDIQQIELVLNSLLSLTDATSAVLLDKGGFVITSVGDCENFDVTTLGALAAAAYTANQAIAGIIQEPNFRSVYQQGEKFCMLIGDVNEQCLILIVFPTGLSVGVVKYYAVDSVKEIAAQLNIAGNRSPEQGLDLSISNVADTSPLFQRKADEASHDGKS